MRPGAPAPWRFSHRGQDPGPLTLREIPEIDEAFITSSSRGVVPVAQIIDQPVGNGKVGETTKQLISLFEQKISSVVESIT